MNNDAVNKTLTKPMIVGVVTLILGVVIGVAAEKFAVRRPVLAAGDRAASIASGSPNVATTNQLLSLIHI